MASAPLLTRTLSRPSIIGANSTIHGCTIEDGAYIGHNVRLVDVTVGSQAIVGSGSVVTATTVPAQQLYGGKPGRYLLLWSIACIAPHPTLFHHDVLPLLAPKGSLSSLSLSFTNTRTHTHTHTQLPKGGDGRGLGLHDAATRRSVRGVWIALPHDTL